MDSRGMTTEYDTIEQVPAGNWQDWLAQAGGMLIDVREPIEWAMGTLPGAERISLAGIPASLDRLDRSTPLLIVCRSGNRSYAVARFLSANGFERVANLAGGMRALGLAA